MSGMGVHGRFRSPFYNVYFVHILITRQAIPSNVWVPVKSPLHIFIHFARRVEVGDGLPSTFFLLKVPPKPIAPVVHAPNLISTWSVHEFLCIS